MLRVTHNPSEAHLETVKVWNLRYLDTAVVEQDPESVLFFLRGEECIGYTELDISPEVIYISWFCAPGNGSVCMELLLDYLCSKNPSRTALELNVNCQSHEPAKAIPARLNLYTKFGFTILTAQWCGAGHLDLRMARWLK